MWHVSQYLSERKCVWRRETSRGNVSTAFLSMSTGRTPGSAKAVLNMEHQTKRVKYAAMIGTAGESVYHKSTPIRPKKTAGMAKTRKMEQMKGIGLSLLVTIWPEQQKRRLAGDSW